MSLVGGGGQGEEGPHTMRSHVQRQSHGSPLYGDVQCTKDNGHTGPCLWTEWGIDTTENITVDPIDMVEGVCNSF